ncbi:hypothetical protein FOA52_009878 [Chlamydomonas sp. UWO 241]|nr:hypothetical protein FOA52_009878 [Chlamydomonas sp. UWO 241]
MYALEHPPAFAGVGGRPSWSVRILPRVAFGVTPHGDIPASAAGVFALHHFAGSWKKVESWRDCRGDVSCIKGWVGERWRSLGRAETKERKREVDASAAEEMAQRRLHASHLELYPVSADFEPEFVVMTHLVGHGDELSGSDVNSAIFGWGGWQAGLSPVRTPSVVEALVGSLGAAASRSTLVDVGAGPGFFSLAAAARGHRALAFEGGSKSLSALKASVQYNGFDALVDARSVPLGAKREQVCLRRAGPAGASDAADVHMQRGYGDPAAHAARGDDCAQLGTRETLASVLAAAELSSGGVGALRLSANGWEGHIVDGAKEWLSAHPPRVVHLEFSPERMAAAGYEGDATRLLETLYALGYTRVAHAGAVCDARWGEVTRELRGSDQLVADDDGGADGRSPLGPMHHEVRQATWCRIEPASFHMLGAELVGRAAAAAAGGRNAPPAAAHAPTTSSAAGKAAGADGGRAAGGARGGAAAGARAGPGATAAGAHAAPEGPPLPRPENVLFIHASFDNGVGAGADANGGSEVSNGGVGSNGGLSNISSDGLPAAQQQQDQDMHPVDAAADAKGSWRRAHSANA